MKKLNQKGIGHHLLVLVVAVMAVVGSAGYFVWQRQGNNYASAASATIYTAAVEGQTVSIKACRVKGKLNVNVTYNIGKVKSLVGSKALLVGLGEGKALDVEATNWSRSGVLTIKNYYAGQGGANGSSFDAFIIPSSGSLPNNGGAMQVYVMGLPSC